MKIPYQELRQESENFSVAKEDMPDYLHMRAYIKQLEKENDSLSSINEEQDEIIEELQREIIHLKAYNRALQHKVNDYVSQLLEVELTQSAATMEDVSDAE